MSLILGIESSCDDSALALFDTQQGIAGEWTHSQIEKHQAYGGIVPDLASREHLKHFPVLLQALHRRLAELPQERPDLVAVTAGPGLAGSLALGIALAKSLSLVWHIPVVGASHLRGHAWSPFLPVFTSDPEDFPEALRRLLPHLGLIVSGGNTLLFELRENVGKETQDAVADGVDCGCAGFALRGLPQVSLRVVARTVDDAAGEALDKGAKLLGMPYPGGPLIEKLAREGDPCAFAYPRAFSDSGAMKFSFSGLKTSLRYQLEKLDEGTFQRRLPDICASYQEAVAEALCIKVKQALRRGRYNSVGLSGGVANNGRLQSLLSSVAGAQRRPPKLLVAHPGHTGDNAAMIAFAAVIDPLGLVSSCRDETTILPSLPLDAVATSPC